MDAVESQCDGLPAPIHAGGAPLRRDGAQAVLPGERDRQERHQRLQERSVTAGAAAQGDDRPGGHHRQAGRRTARDRHQRQGPAEQLPLAHRDETHTPLRRKLPHWRNKTIELIPIHYQ